MKNYNMFLCLLYALVLMAFLTCCVGSAAYKYYPTQQVKTNWSTEDDTVYFCVGETNGDTIYGYLNTESGQVNVKFNMGATVTAIFVYSSDDEQMTEPLEVWYAKKIKKNSLTVLVEKSTYFSVGETMIIYRNK